MSDFSLRPRGGLKGRSATSRLEAWGATIPEINGAAPQHDGSLLVRLSQNDYLALAPGESLAAIMAFAIGGDNDAGLCPVPRAAALAWFSLAGTPLHELFAKVCGVDLRPQVFSNHRVAQTIVARTNAVIIRADQTDVHRLHLLADATTAAYLWDVLREAMREFGGVSVPA